MAHKSSIRDHSKRHNIDIDKLQDAIKLVKEGMLSLNGASKLIGVSRNTLYRHLQRYINEGKESKLHENKLHQRMSISDVFTKDEEHKLLSNIKDYVSTFKVFSLKAVQELAYHFAKKNNKKYPRSWDEHKMASVSWLQKFRQRYDGHVLLHNSEACIRIVGPPSTPPTKVTSPPTNVTSPPTNVTSPPTNVTLPSTKVTLPSTKVTLPLTKVTLPSTKVTSPSTKVTSPSTTLPPTKSLPSPPTTSLTTFQCLKAAMDKCPLGLPPNSIWNIDEITLYNPPEILTKEMQSFSAVSTESNLTIITAVNAGGDTVPPMMIFPNVDYKDFVLDGAPPETIGAMNSSGGPNEDLFLEFFRHFLRYAKPSKDLPCIVLLDNHESHMCLSVYQLAKEKGVILVTFQPHESHKVQPMEEGVSEVFKVSYNSAGKELLSNPNNVGKKLYTRDISTLVGKAFAMAFTPTNIMQGFRVSGFYPLNENKRTDLKSLLSDVTDRFALYQNKLPGDPRTAPCRSSSQSTS